VFLFLGEKFSNAARLKFSETIAILSNGARLNGNGLSDFYLAIMITFCVHAKRGKYANGNLIFPIYSQARNSIFFRSGLDKTEFFLQSVVT
jgi:hypothetical protein